MNTEILPRTQTPAITALMAGLIVAVAILSLPVVLLENLVLASGLPAVLAAAEAPLGLTARGLIAASAGMMTGLSLWIVLGLVWPAADEQADAYDVFRDDLPILRPIFAATDLGAPFDSIRAADRAVLPFENDPVAEGDAPMIAEPGRMLWEPDPWFDEMQDPEPALIEPVRWGAPSLEAAPIATLSLTELVARLEAGLRRRKAMAAAAPIPVAAVRTAPFSPVRDMDDALRDALGTLQRLAARSA
ncbi:hypothetical protein [Sphingobium boeckii]|uniref:Uncharacterized protein n=1 Tax=Sphingobium boeckii TaxID=1082345 RepID=A0A7W9AI43_9SPHN|nr:hypothetical protein [Sphingobium boeckii]MBB5686025.1 hypothetical protein [Sphingobium boeckii]